MLACRLLQRAIRFPVAQIQTCHGKFFAIHTYISLIKLNGRLLRVLERRAEFRAWPAAMRVHDAGANESSRWGNPAPSRLLRSSVLPARTAQSPRGIRPVTPGPRRVRARDVRQILPSAPACGDR